MHADTSIADWYETKAAEEWAEAEDYPREDGGDWERERVEARRWYKVAMPRWLNDEHRRGRHEAWTLYQTGRSTLLRIAPISQHSDAWKAGYMSVYHALRLRWKKQLARAEREQTEAAIALSLVRQAFYLDTARAVPVEWVTAAYERRMRADNALIDHLCVASHALDRVPALD